QADDQEVIETMHYELKDSSILKIPYRGRTEVIFIDSLSNKLAFTIQENDIKTESMSTYNKELKKCEPPSWTIQSKETELINDSLDLTFLLELKTEPDRADSYPKKFCDKLFLWTVSYPNEEEKEYILFDIKKTTISRHALFQCIVDNRTSEYSSSCTLIDSTVVLGRTFYDVLRQDSYGSENDYSILFNYEYGILAFRDYENKYWRFSHFSK
ncbi:MAG: hypothetical protein MI810_19150, partial [Flavobacteriales bacterium]|nr:hypothetical protein [Flavobacteriales bacterium]